ncbi:MAG: response regulator transcription factor [Chloroflexi bacterium]|nr:response regulator transcription factor [Chloroflexota bacterium]
MIRVFIAEDHIVVRSGLRLLINNEPDITVIGKLRTGQEAIAGVEALQPDIVLMDISLPDMNGIEAIRRLKQHPTATWRIVVLTMHPEADYLRLALDAGADGYVVKSVADDQLLDAIRLVYRGHSFLRPEAVAVLIDDGRCARQSRSIRARNRDFETGCAWSHQCGDRRSPLSQPQDRRHVSPACDANSRSTRADLVDYALRNDLLKPTRDVHHDPSH